VREILATLLREEAMRKRLSFSVMALALFSLVFPWSRAVAGQAGSSAEWENLVAAAKKEGQIQVAGPRGAERRQALTETFTAKYGIGVEYLGVGGFELPPRVQRERQASVYQWDVFMVGTTTLLKGLKPIGALEPIEPALVLPEVKDPKNWLGGALPFFDKNRLGLALQQRAGQYLFVNSNLVGAEDLRSWRDLLHPKWKGKIVVGRDPRVSGHGNATFKFFFTTAGLGPQFIRDLAKQELLLMRDDRLSAQWLAQGKYAICICSDLDTPKLIDAGLPVRLVDARRLKEGGYRTSGNANVALANRAAHPNAAKLYINWILSKEAGTLFSKATGDASLRVDVPTDHLEPRVIPAPEWPITNTEEALEAEEPTAALIKEIYGDL
jgi:iron(III) transport system substrate-binding protein